MTFRLRRVTAMFAQMFLPEQPTFLNMVRSPKELVPNTSYVRHWCNHVEPVEGQLKPIPCQPDSGLVVVVGYREGFVSIRRAEECAHDITWQELGLAPTPAGWYHHSYLERIV